MSQSTDSCHRSSSLCFARSSLFPLSVSGRVLGLVGRQLAGKTLFLSGFLAAPESVPAGSVAVSFSGVFFSKPKQSFGCGCGLCLQSLGPSLFRSLVAVHSTSAAISACTVGTHRLASPVFGTLLFHRTLRSIKPS
uniref:Uncharacterized protein n=1 Tax=Opuntia streptacantha TaxID=393608 RepID=A0A7C9DE65_OPUST